MYQFSLWQFRVATYLCVSDRYMFYYWVKLLIWNLDGIDKLFEFVRVFIFMNDFHKCNYDKSTYCMWKQGFVITNCSGVVWVSQTHRVIKLINPIRLLI